MLAHTHTRTHSCRHSSFSAFSCFTFCICIIAIYCKSVCKNMPEIQSIQRLQLEETPQPLPTPPLSLRVCKAFADRGQRLFTHKSMQICLYKSNSQAQFHNQIGLKENCNSLKLQALPMLLPLSPTIPSCCPFQANNCS